jgi:hypothetical protein
MLAACARLGTRSAAKAAEPQKRRHKMSDDDVKPTDSDEPSEHNLLDELLGHDPLDDDLLDAMDDALADRAANRGFPQYP